MKIIFTGEKSLLSFLVGLRCWSFVCFGFWPRWISHVLVVLDNGWAIEASFSRQQVVSWKWSGLRDGTYGLEVDADRLFSEEEKSAATRVLTSLVGKPYDTKGALAYLVDLPEENVKEAFFCFEVARAAFPRITSKRPQRTVARQLIRGLKRIASERSFSWAQVSTLNP